MTTRSNRQKVIRSALVTARRLVVAEIDMITGGHWEGGRFARAEGRGRLSPEGQCERMPWRRALYKIDAALKLTERQRGR